MAALQQKVNAWNSTWAHLLQGDGDRTRTSTVAGSLGAVPPSPFWNRTHCRPVFSGEERPVDLTKVFSFPEDCIVPKEALTEFLDGPKDFIFVFCFAFNLNAIVFAALECMSYW